MKFFELVKILIVPCNQEIPLSLGSSGLWYQLSSDHLSSESTDGLDGFVPLGLAVKGDPMPQNLTTPGQDG